MELSLQDGFRLKQKNLSFCLYSRTCAMLIE